MRLSPLPWPVWVHASATALVFAGLLVMIALLSVLLGTLAGQMSKPGTWSRKFGVAAAVLGVTGAACDAVEDLISFCLMSNLSDVSQVWAMVYSSFAAAKFILLILAMAAVHVSVLFGLLIRLKAVFGRA